MRDRNSGRDTGTGTRSGTGSGRSSAGGRSLLLPLALVAATALAGAGGGVAQARTTAADTAPATTTVAATGLRIMDWNIEGANSSDGDANWSAIEATIRSEDPDVITMQEVHDDEGHTVDGAPGINQWQRLLDDFPQYQGHFARGDATPVGGSAGQLILVT